MRGRDRGGWKRLGSFPSTHTDRQVVLTLYLERLPSVARLGESSRTLGSLQEGQGDSEFRERKCKKKKKHAIVSVLKGKNINGIKSKKGR